MRTLQLVSQLALAGAAVHATPFHYTREQASKIQWSECDIPNATVPLIECGTLEVPLDYTVNRPNETLALSLQRVPASRCPKQGSILLNFGGPGFDGVGDFAFFAQRMQAATGGYHDLINVVPRGTGETLPFSCYPDDITRAISGQTLTSGNASDAALGQIWAESAIFADTCYAMQSETGSLIGTAFVARDLMQIVDALGEDGLLRYWGVSYGSLLGSTVAAMFPDRMDKVVVDGVVNPFEYYANAEVELFTDMDASFSGFCAGCVARPDICPLAQNFTATELEETIYAFIDAIKFDPFPLGGVVIDYNLVKNYIAYRLYFPNTWPKLATLIYGIMTGDLSALAELAGTGNTAPASGSSFAEAPSGIKCSDVLSYTNVLDEKRDVFRGRLEKSRIGGDAADATVARCSQWRMPAKERYDGNFKVQTKNPMLIIGNTFDPVTPLVSAQNLSETIDTSVLLQHDSYGHDSLMVGSLCTAQTIRSYFVKGVLPEKGTICGTDVQLFDETDGWDEIIAELEANPLKL